MVTGHDDAAVRAALVGLTVRFVVNPRPEDGQGTSIATGAVGAGARHRGGTRSRSGTSRGLPADMIPALLRERERTGKAIVAPVVPRDAGHARAASPPRCSPSWSALEGDAGARAVVGARPERVARISIETADAARRRYARRLRAASCRITARASKRSPGSSK